MEPDAGLESAEAEGQKLCFSVGLSGAVMNSPFVAAKSSHVQWKERIQKSLKVHKVGWGDGSTCEVLNMTE